MQTNAGIFYMVRRGARLKKQGSSENGARSEVNDRSEFKIFSNWCYQKSCCTICGNFPSIQINYFCVFVYLCTNIFVYLYTCRPAYLCTCVLVYLWWYVYLYTCKLVFLCNTRVYFLSTFIPLMGKPLSNPSMSMSLKVWKILYESEHKLLGSQRRKK